MDKNSNILHKAKLVNNCPTCFNQNGLELTFTQNEKENAFFHKPSPQIDDSLYCHNCNNPIYPVNWTEDIERVYDYNKKIAETKKQYLKVKPLFYIIIITAVIIASALLYVLIS